VQVIYGFRHILARDLNFSFTSLQFLLGLFLKRAIQQQLVAISHKVICTHQLVPKAKKFIDF